MQKNPSPRSTRRSFFAGAAAAGAATAAVVALPQGVFPSAADGSPATRPAPEKGGGYHLTEHIRQYYKTTMI